MRKPGEQQPDPPGGRAAERLREFLGARFGQDAELPPGAEEPATDAEEPSRTPEPAPDDPPGEERGPPERD
jgi:hypothetical protein